MSRYKEWGNEEENFNFVAIAEDFLNPILKTQEDPGVPKTYQNT